MPAAPPSVIILSRCSWTLYNFRLPLALAAREKGARTLVAGCDSGGWGQRVREAGVEFRNVPVSQSGVAPFSDLLLLYSLVRLFRNERPTVVHSFTIKPAIYGSVAAWIARVPVRVVTITGLGHVFVSGNRHLRLLVEYLYRFALARAHAVVFQNEDDRALFLQRGLVRAEKTRLAAGSGVDLTRFAASPLPSANGRKPTVVMVARLLKEKGIVEYVEAARRVRAANPEIRLLLAGGVDVRNPSHITEAQFNALNADNVVEWLGEVDDVVPIIREADIVVLPSYREGTPRSLLEAAAMARPLVTTDAPGCRDVVKDGVNGRQVPVGNARALGDVILEMVDDADALVRMGKASRAIVEEKYDEDRVIKETLLLYSEFAHGSKND